MAETFYATRQLSSDATLTDVINFASTKILQNINTMILGKVISVDTLNKRLVVQSLINGVDSKNLPITPPQLYDVPYCAQRGGNAGLITQFTPDDTVVIGFCQRQIDTTKKTQTQSTPSLIRFHSIMDAVVLSHWSNNEPTVFIKILDSGITIQSAGNPITIQTTSDINVQASNVTINATTKFTVNSPDIELNGNTNVNGILKIGNTTITTTGISNTGGTLVDNVQFLLHTHNGVTPGSGNSGTVNP